MCTCLHYPALSYLLLSPGTSPFLPTLPPVPMSPHSLSPTISFFLLPLLSTCPHHPPHNTASFNIPSPPLFPLPPPYHPFPPPYINPLPSLAAASPSSPFLRVLITPPPPHIGTLLLLPVLHFFLSPSPLSSLCFLLYRHNRQLSPFLSLRPTVIFIYLFLAHWILVYL